ncbi:MAG: hypothetical protein LBU15_04155, partial [Rickettsiales bacterium]|nr:hypothetical protein [Rickettsiales bacterium]
MQNTAMFGCSREFGSTPETSPRRESFGDSRDSRDSRGFRILALAVYLFLSLLGHPGPARGKVKDASSTGPF